jgi:hypothetical protein
MRANQFLSVLREYNRDITAKNWGERILAVAQALGIKSVDAVLDALEQMDPTKNKQYVQWLVGQFVKGNLDILDTEHMQYALTLYHQIKNRLPAEARDIGRLSVEALNTLLANLTSGELGAQSALQGGIFPVVEGSTVLYNGPYGQLARPNNFEQALELSTGTRWCTTREHMFKSYTRQGDLWIWRDRSGEKFQLHPVTGQIKNSSDLDPTTAEIERIKQIPPLRQFIIKYCLQHYYGWIRYVPDNYITVDRAKELVLQRPYAIKYLPKRLRMDKELCQIAADRAADMPAVAAQVLRYIPSSNITADMVDKLFRKNVETIQYIPDRFITEKMALRAVKQLPALYKYIPKQYKTQKLSNKLLDNPKYEYLEDLLNAIPPEHLTEENIMKLISVIGKKTMTIAPVIYILQKRLKGPLSDAVYNTAIKFDGGALQHIPKDRITADMANAAVNNNYHAYLHVPDELKTQDMANDVVSKAGYYLRYVPQQHRTPELYMDAVSRSANAIFDIPAQDQTDELWITACVGNPLICQKIPSRFKSSSLYAKIISKKPQTLKFIPRKYQTRPVLNLAVTMNPRIITEIPIADISPEMARFFDKNDLLDTLPDTSIRKLILECFIDGMRLKTIVDPIYDMYVAAVYQNPKAIEFVPTANKRRVLRDVERLHAGNNR